MFWITVITFTKINWILPMHSNVTIKNVSWPHFSWLTLYVPILSRTRSKFAQRGFCFSGSVSLFYLLGVNFIISMTLKCSRNGAYLTAHIFDNEPASEGCKLDWVLLLSLVNAGYCLMCCVYRVKLSAALRAMWVAVVRLRIRPGCLWRTKRLLQWLGRIGRSL